MKLTVACCQFCPSENEDANITLAEQMIKRAAHHGADFVILPEMFLRPNNSRGITRNAEPEDGYLFQKLQRFAAQNQIYLFAGSVPERDKSHIYNTCYTFDRDGRLIGKYRKIHLFDADFPTQIRESRRFSAGNQVCVVTTEFGRVGVAICYDLRFPEIFRMMADRDAKMIVVPAAFTKETGEQHWDLLIRSRAMDSQSYLFACAPAADSRGKSGVWGHSAIVGPWGNVISRLDNRPGVLISTVDPDTVDQVRAVLPVLEARRQDVYHMD